MKKASLIQKFVLGPLSISIHVFWDFYAFGEKLQCGLVEAVTKTHALNTAVKCLSTMNNEEPLSIINETKPFSLEK